MYVDRIVNIDARIEAKEILFCKYRLLLNKPEYGFMTGISVLGFIYFVSLFFSNDFEKFDFGRDILSHFPGSIIAIVSPILVIFIVIKNWISNKKEFKNEKFIRMNFFFSNFGLTFSSKTETNVSWNNINRVLEKRKYFFIYTSEHSLVLVPKRDFENSEQIELLRSIFNEKLPRKKLSLKMRN